jgi:DNA ligase-associated metallophosphoesterase
MRSCTLPISIHGEELLLHPERAVIWPRCRTVIVADTHFGKSGHFGRHGIAVPAGSDEADRERLNRLIMDTDARRLVILGDFLHAPLADGGSEANDIQAWAEQLGEVVDIHVIAGNHDRGGSWTRSKPLQWWETSWVNPPFLFIHDANRARSRGSNLLFSMSGHVHPVVRLRGAKRGGLRAPVFWQKAGGLVLPSFGLFTGGFAVTPAPGERLYAVGSSGVVLLGRVDHGSL